MSCKTHEFDFQVLPDKHLNLKHGPFFQRPQNHMQGNGCPKCYNKVEGLVAQLLNNKEVVHREYSLGNKKFDFYLPEYEVVGGQSPQKLVGEFFEKLNAGECDMVLLAGGEAMANIKGQGAA